MDFNIHNKTFEILKAMDAGCYDHDLLKSNLRTLECPDIFIETLIMLVESESNSPGYANSLLKSYAASYAGYEEVKIVMDASLSLGMPVNRMIFNPSITRGLDYYTGTVYETYIKGKNEWGSVCSGGRYDDLTSYYTQLKFPGTGISIGLTRLIDLLFEGDFLKLGPSTTSKVIITTLDKKSYLKDYLALAKYLRDNDIPTEIILEDITLREQLAYASKKGIRFAVIAGSREFSEDLIKVRDLYHHLEETVTGDNLIGYLKSKLDEKS